MLKMLVENFWGGTSFNDDLNKETFTQTLADFQIGDIICFRQNDTSNYWIAFYQGDNKFLTNASDNVKAVYSLDELCALGNGDWQYYYVLRPAQYLNSAS